MTISDLVCTWDSPTLLTRLLFPFDLLLSFVIATSSTPSPWQRRRSPSPPFASRHRDQGRRRRHIPFSHNLQDHCPFCSGATFVFAPHDVSGDVASATSGVSPHPSSSLSLREGIPSPVSDIRQCHRPKFLLRQSHHWWRQSPPCSSLEPLSSIDMIHYICFLFDYLDCY